MNGEDSQEVVPLPNIARASVDCGGAFLDSDPLDAFRGRHHVERPLSGSGRDRNIEGFDELRLVVGALPSGSQMNGQHVYFSASVSCMYFILVLQLPPYSIESMSRGGSVADGLQKLPTPLQASIHFHQPLMSTRRA